MAAPAPPVLPVVPAGQPGLPVPPPPGASQAELATFATEMQDYLSNVYPTIQAEANRLSQQTTDLTARSLTLQAEIAQRDGAIQRLDLRLRNLETDVNTQEAILQERLRDDYGVAHNELIVFADFGTQISDYYNRYNIQPPIPAPRAEPEATAKLMEALQLRNQIAQLRLVAMQSGIGPEGMATYARRVRTEEGLVRENQRLNQLAVQADMEAQRLLADNQSLRNELTEAQRRVAALDAQVGPNLPALAEQYAALAMNRYVNVGDINSPEQSRLVAIAAMARKTQLETRAASLAASLPSFMNVSRGETEKLLLAVSSALGAVVQHGSIPGLRRVFRFSNESDAIAFQRLVSITAKTIYPTIISPSIVLVTVEW